MRGARPRVFPPLRGRRASRQCDRHPQARRAKRRPRPSAFRDESFPLSHPGEPRWFASSWASFVRAPDGDRRLSARNHLGKPAFATAPSCLGVAAVFVSSSPSCRKLESGDPPLHGRGFFICAGERQQPLPQCGFSARSLIPRAAVAGHGSLLGPGMALSRRNVRNVNAISCPVPT